jgi:hypothetical protein
VKSPIIGFYGEWLNLEILELAKEWIFSTKLLFTPTLNK